jgi:hypothetical protein
MGKRHICQYLLVRKFPSIEGGIVFEICLEDEEGRFWVDTTDRSDQVNYCPYCGAKAPVQVITDAQPPKQS